MRFRPGFLMPRFGCSKPAQLSERDELPPSRPVAPSPADLTGHEKSRNRFALGRRIPGWLQTRLEGKPKQAKKDTIDSGYASSSATDAKVPAASIPPDIPTFAQPFKEKVMELRQELSSEVERFLSAPDRKVLLSSSNPTWILKEQEARMKATLAEIQEALSAELSRIENDNSLDEVSKKAAWHMLPDIFSAEKNILKQLVVQRYAEHEVRFKSSSVVWEDTAGAMLTHKNERWELQDTRKSLGDGSFGAVVLLHSADGNKFAGKISKRALPGGVDSLRYEQDRFEQVYKKVGMHPNLVNVYGIAHVTGCNAGQRMLLMDAIPGESGDKFFERLARYYQSGKLTSEEYFGAIQFINAGVLKAIDHIQKAGLVHSDIKPENIIISRDTLEAKVIDLGVAQQRGSHTMAGTPGFMSMDHEINDIGMTQKSDVYSSAAMVVDAMEGLGKLRRDPLRSRWKPADPNDGALCRTYLTPLLPNANPADYREVKAFNKEKYLKRRMNRVFTSYSHFVNKQLLGVDPFTGNMLRSQPAARDTAAEALKHPFFSDGVQMDEALARKVAEKVFKLMAEEDAVPGPMPPQLPELKFAKTLLSTQSDMIFHLLKEREDFLLNPTLEGLVHLQNFAKAHDLPETKTDFSILLTGQVASKLRKERDQLLAELLPEPAWLSAVETLYRNQDKIRSNIKFYDRSGAPEPNQETTTPVDEGNGNNQNKKRKAPNGYFPGNAFDVRERGIMKEHLREDNIDATARNIRRYVHDANRLFKGHSFIPDGNRSLAEVKQDMATIAKRVGIAQDFLQRYERSAPASMAFSRPARKDIPVPVKVKKDASTTAKRRADSKH